MNIQEQRSVSFGSNDEMKSILRNYDSFTAKKSGDFDNKTLIENSVS